MGLRVGGWLKLSYQNYGEGLVMRVDEKTISDDRAQAVKIEISTDRYVEAITDYVADVLPAPDSRLLSPQPLVHPKFVEIPRLLLNDGIGERVYMALLAGRKSKFETASVVWASVGGGPYRCVQRVNSFTRTGLLTGALGRTAPVDDIDSFSVAVDSADTAISQPGSDAEWRRGVCLAFIEGEIISYRSVNVYAGYVVISGLIRGFAGTANYSHASGSVVHFIARDRLVGFTSSLFNVKDTVSFKAQSSTGLADFPLAGVAAIPVTLTGASMRPIPPLNLTINGQSAHWFWRTGTV